MLPHHISLPTITPFPTITILPPTVVIVEPLVNAHARAKPGGLAVTTTSTARQPLPHRPLPHRPPTTTASTSMTATLTTALSTTHIAPLSPLWHPPQPWPFAPYSRCLPPLPIILM